ncbi:MAG: Fic family protein [Gammaproteobacteria bacterium]|nr:Fic family protein [Gammaproteobacteria bacterium]
MSNLDSATDLLPTIQAAPTGLTLATLLAQHPHLPRRTAQRWISGLIAGRQIVASGEGRARRYFMTQGAPQPQAYTYALAEPRIDPPYSLNAFPSFIPLSADSREILAYVDQPVQARHPVGYQRDFLDAYQPNTSWYLSAALRRQLHRIGTTAQVNAPAGTFSRAILNRLLIDLSWASSQLEGNTYSRLDTRELIEHGRAAKGKAAVETQMILNHKNAIEMLAESGGALKPEATLDRFTIMNLHAALAENLLPNPEDEGNVRQHVVDIGKSVYRPLSVPAQIDETLTVLLHKARQIRDPFEQSFFLMVHLPYLQPFADINKRTSRLAANLPLFRANLCPLTFLGVPEQAYSRAILGVYEMARVELLRDLYVWAYERSTQEYLTIRQELAEPDPLRLTWRDLIKQTIREVVTQPQQDALTLIRQAVEAAVPDDELRKEVQALIVEELRRIHEGVLARYGLRPSELSTWKEAQSARVNRFNTSHH